MNRPLRIFVVMAVVGFIAFGSAPLFAQEWSKAQKEVWDTIKKAWELSAKRDLDGFMNMLDDDYSGWYYESATPGSKESARKWGEYYYKKSKILVYDIKPVAIKVHDKFAFVHYYYTEVYEDSEGKEKFSQGRWTDILKKEKDKWLLIGDHGGETDGEEAGD
jgi:ketosteroid isomerase-like protein